MKQDHNGHGIRHYACSDAWEPPEPDVQTTCTVLDDNTVRMKHPAIPGGKVEVEEIYSLNFMR
jgi:hypothetical protein